MSSGELTAEDELCLRIGRVARAHVLLDNHLRGVHQALVRPGLAVYLTDRVVSTAVLVTDCKIMLAKADAGQRLAEAGAATLDAALEDGRVRNRVVHDMWWRAWDDEHDAALDPPQWLAMRRPNGSLNLGLRPEPPRDLAFLDAAKMQIDRANVRVFSMVYALLASLPSFRFREELGEEQRSRELAKWLTVMEDRFDLLADGSFRPHPQ